MDVQLLVVPGGRHPPVANGLPDRLSHRDACAAYNGYNERRNLADTATTRGRVKLSMIAGQLMLERRGLIEEGG
jgi:hypothetical protein